MDKYIDINDLKRIQIDILNYVHSFCEKEKIKYFLMYGTLIGAIRHKGYIPWDDDIDICMPRPDYIKFMEKFNEESTDLKFISYELDNAYPYTFGKVNDTKTRLIEHTRFSYSLGVNIDVFPIDGVDETGKVLQNQIFLRHLLSVKSLEFSSRRRLYKNILLFLFKSLLMIVPTKYLVRKMVENSCKYPYEKSQFVACVAMGTKLNKQVPKEWFDKGILKEFEKQQYYVPIEYDSYLKSVFGNYLELPPEEERIPHHVFEAYYKEE